MALVRGGAFVTRLADEVRSITWQETRHLKVGHHDCPICGEETPEPSLEELVEFARQIESGRGLTVFDAVFMWPDADPDHAVWIPEGWHEDVVDDEQVLICPDCHAAKIAAQKARQKGKKR
jgi:hypothetical protein